MVDFIESDKLIFFSMNANKIGKVVSFLF